MDDRQYTTEVLYGGFYLNKNKNIAFYTREMCLPSTYRMAEGYVWYSSLCTDQKGRHTTDLDTSAKQKVSMVTRPMSIWQYKVWL